MKETEQLSWQRSVIKLPIIIQDNSNNDLGIEAEREEGFGYFLSNEISALTQTHDDSLGKTPINLEATLLCLKGGQDFYIPLHIEEVVKLLSHIFEA